MVFQQCFFLYVFDRVRQKVFCFLFPALICLLFIPSPLNAQIQSLPITYLYSITEDEEEGKLGFPSFVYAEPVKKEIYIIDGKARILIYTSDFFPIFTLSKRNGIEAPLGLTVDAEGNMYVAQASSKDNPRPRISVFNACLKWERDMYLKGFEGDTSFVPNRLAMDRKGNIYVVGSYFPGVLIINNQEQITDTITIEEEDRKVRVNDVTIDTEGKIYLVSEEEGRIYVYDENRNFLFKFGQKGGSTGKLSRPLAVGVDNRNRRLYVVDYMRHTISVYDNEGKYLFEFGGLGWGEGWFQYPRDIAVDSAGRIFIADTFNNRIEVFQAKE